MSLITLFSSIGTGISRRKTAKELSYRLRYLALSSHDQVAARRMRKYLVYCLALSKMNPKVKLLSKIFMLKYLSIMYQSTDDLEPIERPPRWLVTVDSFSASRCYIYFKFKKADLFNLFELLNFPEDCKLYNGGSMKGEEVFLRGLFELCTGMNQTIIRLSTSTPNFLPVKKNEYTIYSVEKNTAKIGVTVTVKKKRIHSNHLQ
jgi:hypothetical protein